MSIIAKVSGIGNVSQKGNQVLRVRLTEGLATDPENYFMLSNPEAIEAYGVEVGTDISSTVANCEVQTSEVPDKDNPEIMRTFKWLVPKK